MRIAPRIVGLAPLWAGLLFAGCDTPAPTPVASADTGNEVSAEPPAPVGAEPAPPPPAPPAPVDPPETDPASTPEAALSRKVEGLPTTDRNALRAKFLPVIAKNNHAAPAPFVAPPSPLEDNKPDEMDPALVKKVNRLKQWAGFLRGKKLKTEIQLAQMSEKDVSAMLLDEKNQELPPEAIFALEEEGIALGLFPGDLDVKKMMAQLVSAGVGAFYEPKSKHFVMVTHDNALNNDPLMKAFQAISDEITTVHELTHAVQDQYFDLVNLLPPDAPSDQASAIRALVEGDATFVMLEYGLARNSGGQRPNLLAKGTGQQLVEAMGASLSQMDNNPMVPESTAKTMKLAPRILSEELMFSYSQGFAFVYALHQAGDADGTRGVKGQIGALDAAFRQPPESTEQILHPEKYIDAKKYDPPTFLSKVDLTRADPDDAKASLPGYTLVGSDELGEYRMRLWFEEILRGGLYSYRDPSFKTRPRPNRQQRVTAEIAATGWDGCRVATYQKLLDGKRVRTVLTLVAVFDTVEDADQAFDVVAARARQMAPADAQQNNGPQSELQEIKQRQFTVSGDFGSHTLLQMGNRLAYVQDAEVATATELAARLLASTTFTESTRKAPDLSPPPAAAPAGGAEDGREDGKLEVLPANP